MNFLRRIKKKVFDIQVLIRNRLLFAVVRGLEFYPNATVSVPSPSYRIANENLSVRAGQ